MRTTDAQSCVELDRGPRARRPDETKFGIEPARLRFATEEERTVLASELEAAGGMVVRLETIQASARGRLAEVIDEAVERELTARGAAAPGVGSTCNRSVALGDQLFRARRVGANILGIHFGSLRGIVGPSGAIDPEDSTVLRFLSQAAKECALSLVFDREDEHIGAYAEPIALHSLLSGESTAVFALGKSTRARTAQAVPNDSPRIAPPLSTAGSHASSARQAMAQLLEDAEQAPPVATLFHAPTPAIPLAKQAQIGLSSDKDEWRTWTQQLIAARGPQPLSAFERLFAHAYMPLTNAIADGLSDPKALMAHSEFRRAFERSYTEACPTFAVTGKRPRMVFDVPDMAARQARVHGARSTQLLMVDSLRFDVGCMVKSALTRALEGRASLTDEAILWSALPTTTSRQLDTLNRGLDALRSSEVEDHEVDSLRGRSAEIVRRLKVGSRDIFKLDVIESRLRGYEHPTRTVLPDLALATATILARHTEHLAPKTLLVIFGDHGFTLDDRGENQFGGATPEEVLVPAFSFFIGNVH